MICWFHNLWQRLSEPSVSVAEGEGRRQARLTATLTIVAMPIALLFPVMHYGMYGFHAAPILLGIGVVIMLFAINLLARTPYYELGGQIFIFTVLAGTTLDIATNPVNPMPIVFMSFSTVLAIVILSVKLALIWSSVGTLVTLALPIFVPHLRYEAIFPQIFFILIQLILVWVIVLLRHRDLQENRHQAEQLVKAEKQRLELELEQHKASILRDFIQDVSHDLRTPLTTMKTMLYLIQRQPSGQHQERLAVLETQTEYLQKLIESLLTMASLDSDAELSQETVDLNELIKTVVSRLSHQYKTRRHLITYKLDGTIPTLHGDKFQLERCISNLVENAIYYTPRGGRIEVLSRSEAGQVVFEVKDNGIGIREDELQLIFDRFYRADKARSGETPGSGLGLSIVKRIVEGHHGHIHVESTYGEGTTFKISLPAKPAIICLPSATQTDAVQSQQPVPTP